MQLGLAFYILMLLWLVFGLWSGWPAGGTTNFRPLGSTLLLFILLLLLGWQIFGPPLHSDAVVTREVPVQEVQRPLRH